MATTSILSFTNFDIPDVSKIGGGSWDRSTLTQQDSQFYNIPLPSWVSDGASPAHLGTASGTTLGIGGGTFGTDGLQLLSIDEKANAGNHSCYAVNEFTLPPEYIDAQTVQFKVIGGMKTTVADTSATVDIEVYEIGTDGDPTGSDLCTTAAQSINSLTHASKTFTIDAAGLAAGDRLAIRITTTVNDSATGTAVYASVKQTGFLLDIKG